MNHFFLLRVAAASVALTVLQAVVAGLLLSGVPAPQDGGLGFVLLSNLLTAVVLVLLAARMSPGWPRALALLVVWGGIQANNLIEAVFFALDIPKADLPALFLYSFVLALLFAPVVDRLAGAGPPEPASWPAGRGAWSWVARVAACDLAYVLTYFAAGMLVSPFVQSFYSGRPLPDGRAVLLMQLVRGLVFTGLLLLLLSRLAGRRATLAVLAGLALSILGGVAPLLVPNPYMPAAVRFPHLVEVAVSNFLFGLVAALILSGGNTPAPGARRLPTAA